MIELIISALIIVAIMLFYTYFIFRGIIKRLNMNSKKYFVDKLQNYDRIIETRMKQLKMVKEKLEELEKEQENQPKTIEKEVLVEVQKEEKPVVSQPQIQSPEEYLDIELPEFREQEFFNTYRSVREKFTSNNEEVLKKFLEVHVDKKQETKYKKLKKFRDYFDADTIYQCMTLTKEEQFEILQSITKKTDKKILELDKYDGKTFDLMKFLEEIDENIKRIDPNIYVFVGRNNQTYDYLSDRIITKVYKNMIEGIIIQYQGQVYDYSI